MFAFAFAHGVASSAGAFGGRSDPGPAPVAPMFNFRAVGLLMKSTEEFRQAWRAYLRLSPFQATMYALSGSLVVGGVMLAVTEAASGSGARLERSRDEASRIPRLQRQQAAHEAYARDQNAALRAMIEETKTMTRQEKLSAASAALYSFHTGRSGPDGDDGGS